MSRRRKAPRERLLATGQELFYSRGASVGVDALLKEAKVARRSLYEHFGGKDGLIAAVLRRASDEDVAWYENALARSTEQAAEQLHLLIEGTLVTGATQGDEHPDRTARELAAAVVD